MKKVILESPFAGDVERNIKYARLCVKDSLSRGEAPIASHLLYTQDGILDDNIPQERMQGINAGLEWKNINCQGGVLNGFNPKICKSCNPTFKCDGCGKDKPIKEKFEVYNENYKLQKGVYECAECKGL